MSIVSAPRRFCFRDNGIHASKIQPRTSPAKFAVWLHWLGLASPAPAPGSKKQLCIRLAMTSMAALPFVFCSASSGMYAISFVGSNLNRDQLYPRTSSWIRVDSWKRALLVILKRCEWPKPIPRSHHDVIFKNNYHITLSLACSNILFHSSQNAPTE